MKESQPLEAHHGRLNLFTLLRCPSPAARALPDDLRDRRRPVRSRRRLVRYRARLSGAPSGDRHRRHHHHLDLHCPHPGASGQVGFWLGLRPNLIIVRGHAAPIHRSNVEVCSELYEQT